MTAPTDLPAFIAKWRDNARRERASSQEHFLDLCRLTGTPTPNEADPTGAEYTFEAGAGKTSGGTGWADVWRARNAGVTGVYSWWHLISRARERNVGWRIDYFLMDAPEASRRVRSIDYLMDQMGSDHCPVAVEIG